MKGGGGNSPTPPATACKPLLLHSTLTYAASLQQGEGADPDMDLQALLIKHNLSRVSKLHGLEADGKLHTHDAQRNRVL